MIHQANVVVFLLSSFCVQLVCNLRLEEPRGLLYPFESETREVKSLDGVWRFLKNDNNDPVQSMMEKWYTKDLEKTESTIPMPVPSSYNDITTDSSLRDHVGAVWYQRKVFIPISWAYEKRIWLRFGSVHYSAIVWFNDVEVTRHSIGHLPFEVEITNYVKFASENRLTVLCDNTLLNTTIPQGNVVEEKSDYGPTLVQTYTFDFFNYAGIHRSVHLYTTPMVFIQDVQIKTDIDNNNTGIIYYNVTVGTKDNSAINYVEENNLLLHLQLKNKQGNVVVTDQITGSYFEGFLKVPNANLWWPYLMDHVYGYLYKLELYLHNVNTSLLDVYRMKIGIRTIKWTNTSFLINGKKTYLRGFGRHEDSDIKGKGLDWPLLARDFNLLKWIGANAYRTSHYPYSEESMQFADENGIMIIDECPSVNTNIFTSALLRNHKSALAQLVHRDRNHPSVIMWSIANEPRSENDKALDYFKSIAEYVKTLDSSRPLTGSINSNWKKDKMVYALDIISFNRYNAWYHNSGRLDMITDNVIDEAESWHYEYQKPVLMSEYGADTMEGLHFLPDYIWSEDYQSSLLSKHFEAFDTLRGNSWFIGEFVWNFADFKTEQSYTRVGGNKKGVFTRTRQPKAAAYLLRQRYYALCSQLEQCSVPKDVFNYIANYRPNIEPKTEL